MKRRLSDEKIVGEYLNNKAAERLDTAGDVAYEVGVERGKVAISGKQYSLDHRVTNIYHREADGWRIVHHHTDVFSALAAALTQSKVGASAS